MFSDEEIRTFLGILDRARRDIKTGFIIVAGSRLANLERRIEAGPVKDFSKQEEKPEQ